MSLLPIFDNVGNQLNLPSGPGLQKGYSNNSDPNGKKYPIGFTPPEDFIVNPNFVGSNGIPLEYGNMDYPNTKNAIGKAPSTPPSAFYSNPTLVDPKTNLPIEYGNFTTNNFDPTTPDERIEYNALAYQVFDDLTGQRFLHNLDELQGGYSRLQDIYNQQNGAASSVNTQNIYLGSFTKTIDDNEDPTILGYDIEILVDSSPLFNGSIEDFIGLYPNDSELQSRLDILGRFTDQFTRFFNSDRSSDNTPSSTSGQRSDDPYTPPTSSITNTTPPAPPKVYYLKKISGLDNLVEQNTSDKVKSFVDFGKDMIGLTLNEDVSGNMGYLSALYKTLWWSRINGKQMIPDNLLRFDVKITISEVRNYAKIIKAGNGSDFQEFNDLLSKYIYNLYECQLFFPSMPHGSELDMSSVKQLDDFEIKFNYKFSTMQYLKIFGELGNGVASSFVLDNYYADLTQINPNNTNNSNVNNGTITHGAPIFSYSQYESYPHGGGTMSQGSDIQSIINQNNSTNGPSNAIPVSSQLGQPSPFGFTNESPLQTLSDRISNAFINTVSSQITTQAMLLNRTLTNIANALNLTSNTSISPPTNVYYDDYVRYPSLLDAVKDFVGDSIKGFFTP